MSLKTGLHAYAQVFANGVTGMGGSHDGLLAQVGYFQQAAFTNAEGDEALNYIYWADAERNMSYDNSATPAFDEYMVHGSQLKAAWGRSRIFFRFSGDGGYNWTYCGSEGMMDYTVENLLKYGRAFSIEFKTASEMLEDIAASKREPTLECHADADCETGTVCRSGICVAVLDQQCEANADCAQNEICMEGICTCGDGYTAIGSGLCTQGCNSDSECEWGSVCDAESHQCIWEPASISCTDDPSICSATETCVNGQCVCADGNILTDEGLCIGACFTSNDCGDNAHCTNHYTCECNDGYMFDGSACIKEISADCSLDSTNDAYWDFTDFSRQEMDAVAGEGIYSDICGTKGKAILKWIPMAQNADKFYIKPTYNDDRRALQISTGGKAGLVGGSGEAATSSHLSIQGLNASANAHLLFLAKYPDSTLYVTEVVDNAESPIGMFEMTNLYDAYDAKVTKGATEINFYMDNNSKKALSIQEILLAEINK